MRISIFLADCTYLNPPSGENLHGAFLGISKFLKWAANAPEIEALEVFLPPDVMSEHEIIQNSALHLLNPESRGKGKLSFYPYHSIAEVWADGIPRILRSLDPIYMARDRYLRDAFAQGPIALNVDTHVISTHNAWQPLKSVLAASPVPYDSIQCISHSMKEFMLRVFEVLGVTEPPMRLDVIPRPVYLDKFRPPTSDEKMNARKQLGIPQDANVAIYHSRVGPHTKADIYPLIQSFRECSSPNDWLVIGGPPSVKTAYESVEGWLREAKVESRCRLIGSCSHEEVPQRLWAADFFVLPCDNPTEGLGIAPIEALACGLPVLVSDWDGMREAVREGVNGMFIPTHWFPGSSRIGAFSPITGFSIESMLLAQCIVLDQQGLTTKLDRLFHDPDLRKKLSQGALETSKDYTTTIINQRVFTTFQSQLAEAAKETDADREARRQPASNLMMPTDFERLLPPLGSRTVQDSDMIELTETGNLLLSGKTEMAVYEEVSMLARPQDILEVLSIVRTGPKSIGQIIETLGPRKFTDGYYVLAFLTKRNIVRLTEKLRNG